MIRIPAGSLVAVITGVAGQDGSYLADYLLDLGYHVVGVSRRKSVEPGMMNLEHIMSHEQFTFLEGDITDATFISRVLHQYHPHEWYNLAAMSHVGQSFKEPVSTFDVDASSVVMQLEMIRQVSPYTRFYQASTSELFGGLNCPKTGFNEDSPFHPRSPYAVAKLAAYWAVVNYREGYNLFACNGILFNHSSPRRGIDFATRKITRGAARVRYGIEKSIKMGNLSAFRDEGHAKDYVRAMHKMLQQDEPEEYVISTGDGATIEDMFRHVAQRSGFTFEELYEQDERFMRPSEVMFLRGDSTKAREKLGWKPEYTWKTLLDEMYDNDIKLCKKELGQI